MEKLRFEFEVKTSEDPKSNEICITSTTDSRKRYISNPGISSTSVSPQCDDKNSSFQKSENYIMKETL